MAVRKVIMIAIQKNIKRNIIESSRLLVVNSITGKIWVPKKINNLVEDIKILSHFFRDIRIEYCNRLINGDANAMAKYVH